MWLRGSLPRRPLDSPRTLNVDAVNTSGILVVMSDQTKKYHHGDLRAALLAEAAAMVDEGGAAGVTMRALGGRLGVSRAAAYRHFEDKTALLVAVAAVGFDRLRERVQNLGTGAAGSGAERFRSMGEQYVRFALENPAHYRLMYGREALTREEVPELRDAANALFEQLVTVITSDRERWVETMIVEEHGLPLEVR